jgi:hypothetical protein
MGSSFSRGQIIGSATLGFALLVVITVSVVLFVANGGIGFGSSPESAANIREEVNTELDVPDYVDLPKISGCRWDQLHNICTAHEQGLKQGDGYMARSQAGFLTMSEPWLWGFSALKFIGTTNFIITAEDDQCNVGTDIEDCNQVFFFTGKVPNTGYFSVPPHKQIFNRFAMVRRQQDEPYYRYVNLRVLPNELCYTLECREIRNSLQPYFLAYGKKGDSVGFYFDVNPDNPHAIFEWDWNKEEEAPARPIV